MKINKIKKVSMKDGKLIIVSLTSWSKRINSVYKTIDCLLKQTLKPDFIELNLSLEEFPNREKDLPEILVSYANEKKININWVDGNTKAFKKIIPTVQKYYGKEYFLLSVDDDCLYREDYVNMMIGHLNSSNFDFMCMRNEGMAGSRMIYKSSCFGPDFWNGFKQLPKEVVSKSVDDSYYLHYLRNKGKRLGTFMPSDFKDIFSFHDEIESLHEKYRSDGYMSSITSTLSKLDFKND